MNVEAGPFTELLQDACLASKLAYAKNPQEMLETTRNTVSTSLSFAFQALESKTEQTRPWIVAATSPTSNGSRTWFISFRGTVSLEDVLTDINFIPIPTAGSNYCRGHIHCGFHSQANKFNASFLTPYLENKLDRIVLCGHSLGGQSKSLASVEIMGMLCRGCCHSFIRKRAQHGHSQRLGCVEARKVDL